MFDHCDPNTVTVIDTALAEARELGHSYLGTEHLLIACSRRRDLLPERVRPLLPPTEILRSRLVAAIGAPPRRDADLLKTVGIDLDEVRSAVRRTFGDAAVARLAVRRVHQPWQPWRRPSRRCTSLLAGTMSVAPRVKQALERAHRDAVLGNAGAIDPARLLLGMIDVEGAMSSRLLVDAGVDPAWLRRYLGGAEG